MVMKVSKPVAHLMGLEAELDGDAIILRNGETGDFHLISPEADSERMRMVGALGEMLHEQVKKTFGVKSLFIVAQNEEFKLIMFPKKDGFVIWKTNLDTPKITAAVGTNKKNR
jgi:hypothetical protein